MSSEDDKCFQCQESGHTACHCPNIRCFDCNEYGHVTADCPDKIPQSSTPAHHGKHHSSMRHQTRSTFDIITGTDRFSRSRSHSCTHRYRSHSQNNSQRSHSRSYHRCPHRSTSHHRYSSTYHYGWDTPHKRSSLHRSSSMHSRDCSRSRPCTLHKTSHTASSEPSCSSNKTAWKHKDKKYRKVTMMTSPSDYYSSDDPSSDSEEDLN